MGILRLFSILFYFAILRPNCITMAFATNRRYLRGLSFMDILKRPSGIMWLAIIVSFESIYVGKSMGIQLVQYMMQLYLLSIFGYAWKVTHICPLEIMGRTRLWKWPRAFQLMYKQRAVQMMLLYFTGALVVCIKLGIVITGIAITLYRYIYNF